eukprot:NODE_43_length_3051_cov_51.273484_g39_i0.p1 GENE.NODE_43_length_3051_cov_51.273484_g39_i0~~NODE_43_length_3051_cov_51.273484_g39_i0.p1  ORF type:complete len:947 (+),score=311.90 NODE_43_length_3051_cov_51.273484_g39_i0:56-2896(+)
MSFLTEHSEDFIRSETIDSQENENFKVVIRVRPPLPRELQGDRPFVDIIKIPSDGGELGNVLTITEHLEGEEGSRGILSSQTFTFDTVYEQSSSQETVYENTAKHAVLSVLEGYNATMIAYGQTGTGKTYTMEGFTSDEHRGIIPRATEEIFNYIQNCGNPRTKFLVRASYLQIYNEVISDLIKPNPGAKLSIREDKQKGVYVENLSEWIVRSPQEIYGLMDMGSKLRTTGATRMSEMSSRSHAIFTIICEQGEEAETEEERRISVKIGKLNIVDLAGSEKVRQTGATGQRLEESKKINWSLSALGKVISALTDSHWRQHVPYRDSKITRILEDSLGGNCRTTMIAMISPAMDSYSESLSTLKFANRAKSIKNEARINEDLDQKAELRKYERELKLLRQALMEATRSVHESRRQLDMQEKKQVAEKHKIADLERNMLMGGQEIEDHPAFLEAMQKVNDEYNAKLEELDKERQAMEEDKAQVDRYKQLLLKQRDIMIALTSRLNERDETILGLQEELDAYDLQQRMMEEALDKKAGALLLLQRQSTAEQSSPTPVTMPLDAACAHADHVRRLGSDGEACYLSEEGRQKEAAGQRVDSVHTLTAHQKVQELYQALAQAQQSSETQKIMHKLREAQEEKASVEYLLREKLEQMVQSEIADRLTSYKKEVEEWRIRCSTAEEKRRAAEHLVDLQRGGSLESMDLAAKVKEFMAAEVEMVKKPYLDQLADLNMESQAREEERQRALKEADRLRFELHQLKTRLRSIRPESENDSEVERLWKSVQAIEEETKHQKPNRSPTGRSPLDDLSNRQSGKSVSSPKSEDPVRVKQLEQKLESVRWQHDKMRREASEKLEENAQHIQHLESVLKEYTENHQKLAHHMQERRALKIIMEDKIKKRIDGIEKLFREFVYGRSQHSHGPENQKKLEDQIKALQSLVNAAITAMGEDANVK